MNTRLAALKNLSRSEKALIVVFLVTLPLVNPWVRGDGVGYYAYARAMLIEHSLDFRSDWKSANQSFTMGRLDANGNLLPEDYTVTGHIENHFTVGPAILWAPFLIGAHAAVLLVDALGAHIPPDGFSWPYLCDGDWNGGLWIPGTMDFIPNRAAVFQRVLGGDCDLWDLVCEFPAGVYVFQSFVVACAFGFCRGPVFVVLEPNAREKIATAMDRAGTAHRLGY